MTDQGITIEKRPGKIANQFVPVEGCPYCQSTGGVLGCPIHGPNAKPIIKQAYCILTLRCPHCHQDMDMYVFPIKEVERHKL